MAFIVVVFFFGLATAVVGKIKGSSFFIWLLVGCVLPLVGLLAALFYRFERDEPRRRCDECGALLAVTNQVCTRCGADLDSPRETLVKRRGSSVQA